MRTTSFGFVPLCICGDTNAGVLRLWLRMTAKNKQQQNKQQERRTGSGRDERHFANESTGLKNSPPVHRSELAGPISEAAAKDHVNNGDGVVPED
jgi:hypothetical protein